MVMASLSLSAAAATVLVCVGKGAGKYCWLVDGDGEWSDDFHLAVIWREP